MSKILVKQQQSNIMYTRDIGDSNRTKPSFMQNLATLGGGARGLVTDPQTGDTRQGFIPGSELGAAKPTKLQRLGAAGNIAGAGLGAALTAFQTAQQLQGGNIGAIGGIKDSLATNVQGLTGGGTTEAQQAQNIATDHYNKVQEETQQQNITGMPSKFLQEVQNAQQPQQYAVGPQNRTGQVGSAATTGKTGPPPPPTSTGTAPPGTQSTPLGQLQPQPVQPTQPVQPGQGASNNVAESLVATVPQGMFGQPSAQPAPAQPAPVNMQGDKIDEFIANRGRMPASNIDHNEIDAMNTDEVRRRVDTMKLKSFVDMMFNEFGDLFQKQNPDTVAAIITGVYLDKMVR